MLVIEENMFRLAKMQETLLKVSTVNRKENLEKYAKTVSEIDTKAFEYIIEKTKHIDEHNQSLEDEVKFLKELKVICDQLIELQSNFKDNCKKYGNIELQLSDLSSLNIEYIENRINAIESYLMNLKNIETNKEKLQKLNEQLIEEEKKKVTLDSKLKELEKSLIDGFGNVEGRAIIDGKLEYTNIILEYKKINFDFERLLNDSEYLKSSLSYIRREKNEISEKVKVAEVCYTNMPSYDSKQILDEINIEYLRIKYKLTMLEIVELLSREIYNYDEFIEKRKSISDLIKYRLVCMESLGIKTSIDPFGRIKIKEQLEIVQSLTDNSKIISNIIKEISKLNSWTEEMIFQNNGYLITISSTEELIKDKVSFNDIDITPTVSFDELLIRQTVEDNQVVRVRNISSKFNMNIIGQKTSSVIKRVNQMMNGVSSLNKKNEEIVPELVIVPVEKEEKIEDLELIKPETSNDDVLNLVFDDDGNVEESEVVLDTPVSDTVIDNSDLNIFSEPIGLFENVTPFEEPNLFADRLDEEVSAKKKETDVNKAIQFDEFEFVEVPNNSDESVIIDDIANEMPEVFWVTQDDSSVSDNEKINLPSFDEQINALLSYESNDEGKVKKKVA